MSGWSLSPSRRSCFTQRLQYAGTADLIARDAHGGLVVVDWKRSKAMYRDYPYQVAAYAEAVTALTGEKCEAWVCRLPQGDEAYEAKRVRDYDDALNAFLLALGLDIAVAKEVW